MIMRKLLRTKFMASATNDIGSFFICIHTWTHTGMYMETHLYPMYASGNLVISCMEYVFQNYKTL